CTLWAPACTMKFFFDKYWPAIQSGAIGEFALFTLTDNAEQDDNCANIYHKSLLYLVSNAFEDPPRIPVFRNGVPLLGMARWVGEPGVLSDPLRRPGGWIQAPNTLPEGDAGASATRHHGDFDDDHATLKASLRRMLGHDPVDGTITLHRSMSA